MKPERVLAMIAVMAVVTYLVRMLPLLLIKKKIENRFLQSFLRYIPFAVLAAMVIPDIFYSTASAWSALAGLVTAVVLSLCNRKLLSVAVCSCVAVYAAELLLRYLETGTVTFF